MTEHSAWKTWAAICGALSLAGDLLKPWKPWLIPLLLCVSLLVVAYVVVVGKHRRGALVYAVAAAALVAAVTLGQAFTATSYSANPGILASLSRAVASVQITLLPLSPQQSRLLTLREELASPEQSSREDAARRAFSNADPEDRRTIMYALLAHGDPQIRAFGVMEAIDLKVGTSVPLALVPISQDGPLAAALNGMPLFFRSASTASRSFYGDFGVGRDSFMMSGSVSPEGVIVSTTIRIGDSPQLTPLALYFTLQSGGQLLGTAKTVEHMVTVMLPVL